MTTNWRGIITQGIVAGLLGFAVVAFVFAVVNLGAGRSPFYSAAVLGSTLFYGVTDPALVRVTPATVLAYNGLHLFVFLWFGIVAAALAQLADRGWQLWFVALFFFIFVSFHLIAAVQGLAAPMRAVLSDAMVWGAGLVASLAMALYIVRRHPGMRSAQPW